MGKSKNTGTKICKHCQSEIPKKAKVCPNCRKKQGGKLKWIIIAIVVIGIIGAAMGGGGSDDSTAKSDSNSKADTDAKQEETIEYTQVSISDMVDALDKNAAAASDEYKDKYLEITGKLSNSNDEFVKKTEKGFKHLILPALCYTNGDEDIINAVKTLSTGDTITVRGKCTDVGEVMGYSLDLEEIVQ
mgnify:CR=1 FL=1